MTPSERPGPRPAAPSSQGPSAPAAQAAAGVVLALARAVRSVGLYEPGNALVRQLLADYLEKARSALDQHGALSIEVRPFEMLVLAEVIYRDADREKSLAFRLFRDGVRSLDLTAQATDEELLQLLEILAIRFTGIHQQEEDTFTLLRMAEFRGISVEGVEGFTPDEESPEPEEEEPLAARALRFQPPTGWDTPLPKLPRPAPLAWRPVPEEELLGLRAREGEGEVAELAFSLARDLLEEGGRAGWPVRSPDLVAFFVELRDALLAGGDLAALRHLVELLLGAGGGSLRDEMVRGLADGRTLELVLAAVPEGAARLPPELVPFLPLLGIDAVLDELARRPSEGRRRLLSQIVLARLPREADAVSARLLDLEACVVRELARGIVARAPERTKEIARRLLGQPDESLRLEGLGVLEAAPGELPIRPLCELLGDRSEAVRIRAVEVLGLRGDETALAPLTDALEGGREVSPGEAEALGRALAQIAPIPASRTFARWLAPKARFLRGLSPEQRMQQWAAVAGLGELAGAGPETALVALADRSEGELRKHCLVTLARRKKTHAPGR